MNLAELKPNNYWILRKVSISAIIILQIAFFFSCNDKEILIPNEAENDYYGARDLGLSNLLVTFNSCDSTYAIIIDAKLISPITPKKGGIVLKGYISNDSILSQEDKLLVLFPEDYLDFKFENNNFGNTKNFSINGIKDLEPTSGNLYFILASFWDEDMDKTNNTAFKKLIVKSEPNFQITFWSSNTSYQKIVVTCAGLTDTITNFYNVEPGSCNPIGCANFVVSIPSWGSFHFDAIDINGGYWSNTLNCFECGFCGKIRLL
jgi:hypothetical protein